MSGIKIKGHKELCKDNILIYNKPKYVYIPLLNGRNEDVSIFVKKGDYVYKGTILGKTKGNFKIPILSSVSGTVYGYTDSLSQNGNMVKSIVIENDFKEKVEMQPILDPHKMSKKEFINRLYEAGIIGMGGSAFPTYIKYESESIKTLVINAVECEPYITADYALFLEKTEEILEAIDLIMEIYDIKECYIGVKKKNRKLVKKINNFLGSYLKIKVVTVEDRYPMGWEKNLVLKATHKTYDRLPSEIGVVVNNVSTIYAIYDAIFKNNPLTERVVTFTGEILKHPCNVLVKTGTLASEVIEFLGGYKRRNDITFIAGGPMMGSSLEKDHLTITPSLNCVLVLPYQEEEKEIPCLRCGKCVKACPAKLCPVLIKDTNDKKRLQELNVQKCVECGLCSFVCPSKIPVREYVKQKKELVKEEK